MPKSSMAGSVFPDLEQEQRTTAHPSRNTDIKDLKSAEKIRNSEKIDKRKS